MLLPILSLPTSLATFLADHWILTFLSLIPLLYWYTTRNFDYWTKRGIPGPPNTPFWGSAFSLSIPIPLLYLQYLKQYGKCFGVFQGQTPQLVIADPEIIKRILVKDFHLFRNRPDFPPSHRIFAQHLVAAKDNEWKRIRSMLSPLFTTLKLKKMEDLMQACVTSLLAAFDGMAKEGKHFEARNPMSNFTMDVISRCAFATETNAHAEREEDNVLLRHARNSLSFDLYRVVLILAVPRRLQQWFIDHRVWPFYRQEMGYFEGLTRHLIQDRKKPEARKVHHDLLQLMVNAEHNPDQLHQTFTKDLSSMSDNHFVNAGVEELATEEKELRDIIGSKFLSEEEIMAQSLVFFIAGYETTASTLSYCLYELAQNPAIQERLYGEIQDAKQRDPTLSYSTLTEIPYLDAVLSETLRKFPPPLSLTRVATERYYIPELKLTIDPGQAITIPIYAMHHTEEYFPQPEKFDPDRFMPEQREQLIPYSYIPFGGGPRNCIGMRFALTEARMGLARVLDRFRIVKVKGVTSDRLEIGLGHMLLKTSPIELGVEKRQ